MGGGGHGRHAPKVAGGPDRQRETGMTGSEKGKRAETVTGQVRTTGDARPISGPSPASLPRLESHPAHPSPPHPLSAFQSVAQVRPPPQQDETLHVIILPVFTKNPLQVEVFP